jgi:steroid 5-alpha reductase family enzyme
MLALVLFGYMNLWGLGFILIAWVSFFIAGNYGAHGLLVNTLVSI